MQLSLKALQRFKYPAGLTVIPAQGEKYPGSVQLEEFGRWADALDRI
jgi:hypothetical protein